MVFDPGQAQPGILSLPTQVQDAVQTGLMDLKFMKALDSMLAFSAFTYPEPMAARLGETKRFTRSSRLTPNITPANPSNDSTDLLNGMTPNKAGIEQFEISLNKWNALDTVNLFQDEALIASDFLRSLDNMGTLAAQTKERLVRKAYLDTYYSGNTIANGSSANSTTSVYVDDIRGFQTVLDSSGALQNISGTNTLAVNEINPNTGAIVQTFSVTGATADGTNVSGVGGNGSVLGNSDASLGGISGHLTFTGGSTTPTAGNLIVASQAPEIMRAGARGHYSLLQGGDLATIDLFDDGVTYLRNQAQRGVKDGFMYCLAGPSTMRQLRKDPQFQLAYQGRFEAPDLVKGTITEFGGVRYVETTEVPMTTLVNSGSTNGAQVARALMVGSAEACMEAQWQGFDNFLGTVTNSTIHVVQKMQPNLALILRSPIDVQGLILPISYLLTTGFCCGSDLLANKNIIPTASSAMFKKSLWIEHIVG